MMEYNIEFDNIELSRQSPQVTRVFLIIIGFVVVVPLSLGILILIGFGASLITAVAIMGMICIFGSLFLYALNLYIHIYPNKIYFMVEHFEIETNNKKMRMNYSIIKSFFFPIYAFDKNGQPFPQYFVEYKKGLLSRNLHLTEESAKKLAEILSEKGYEYTWDDSQKDRWKEHIKEKGFDFA